MSGSTEQSWLRNVVQTYLEGTAIWLIAIVAGAGYAVFSILLYVGLYAVGIPATVSLGLAAVVAVAGYIYGMYYLATTYIDWGE